MVLKTILLIATTILGLVGCASTTSTANEQVRAGMHVSQVSKLLGKPDSRSFLGDYEAWQYADVVGFGQCEYVTVFISDSLVRSMTSRRGASVAGCGLGSSPVDWSQIAGPTSSGGYAPTPSPAGPPVEGGISGSCFFVSEDGLAITNHHVVENGSDFIVFDHNNRKFDAKLLKIDPANDLALLKVNGTVFEPITFAPFGSLATGDEVFGFGYPVADLLGEEAKFTDGVVSSTTGLHGASNIFQMTVPIQPGSSGGPIVNFQGQVVGVATSTAAVENFLRTTGTLPQNINWAVKGEYAQLLAGIESANDAGVSRNQAIQIAKHATCQIAVN